VLTALRGRPDRDQFQVRWPAAPLQQHPAAHRGVCRLCRGKLPDEGERLIKARRLDLDLHDHHHVARTRTGPGLLAAGTVQPVLVRGAEGRCHTAAVGGLGGEAADHLEVARGVQLLQDREIHRPGRVSGGDQDAEDLLTLLEAGTVACLPSGDKGLAIGQQVGH
jgi:hypothetical protein